MTDGPIINIAHLKLKASVEEFLKVANECADASSAEPGIILYSWYLNKDKKTCDVIGAFSDVDAMHFHASGEFGAKFFPRLAGVADIVSSDMYGPQPNHLLDVLSTRGTTNRTVHGTPIVELPSASGLGK
jgi:quinol monooxygenase YgiN